MIVAILVVARRTSRRVPLELQSHRVAAGLLALLLPMAAEFGGAIWPRGLSVGAYLASLETSEGLVTLLFALFAAIPGLQGPSRPTSGTLR